MIGVNKKQRRAKNRRAKLSKKSVKLKPFFFEIQEGKCHYCGVELVMKIMSECNSDELKVMATFDHIKPLSDGGTNALENLVLVCNTCNGEKDNKRKVVNAPIYKVPQSKRREIILAPYSKRKEA